ncbi:MAG: 4-(cytidine 5'-diphospho)-2-C-methyl-D-erythritol kinase [Candidatus Omnitrophota bacterium]
MNSLVSKSGLVINSYAKLNLQLAVLGRRSDGYHGLETVFEKISLHDKIILKSLSDKKIKIACNYSGIPNNSSNLAYKSAKLLQDKFNLDKGIHIEIIKSIPVGSGMGGGSSNAAAVLTGLNTLWRLKLNQRQLAAFAKQLGSDVPFFIHKTAFAIGTGRGDQISAIKALSKQKFWHILAVPRIKVSTPLIYKKWDELNSSVNKTGRLTMRGCNVKMLTSALKKKDLFLINNALFNDLEEAAVNLYPCINQIKEELSELGVKSILMSGSGPAVFGIVSSRKEAVNLSVKLKKKSFWRIFIARTL